MKNLTLKQRLERAGIDPKEDRWSKGINHHPDSDSLVRDIAEVDFEFFDDHFCWKVGGDGDNGEALMYEIDLLMELRDFELKNGYLK